MRGWINPRTRVKACEYCIAWIVAYNYTFTQFIESRYKTAIFAICQNVINPQNIIKSILQRLK